MTATKHQSLQVHERFIGTAKARSESNSQHTSNMGFIKIRTGALRVKLWIPTKKV